MVDRFDVAVVGGGIAGATAAAHLAPHRSVVLLEQEGELAFHTTSRSAAMFLEADAHGLMAKLGIASRGFFEADHGLDAPLLTPLPVLNVASESDLSGLRAQFEQASERVSSVAYFEGDELATQLSTLCPIIDTSVIAGALYEPTAASVDVMALHQLYVRTARSFSATEIRRRARVEAIERLGVGWRLMTSSGAIECEIVVNASGAWGDTVAEMAGVEPVGLTPMRRTAFTAPVSTDPSAWPFVYCADRDLHCYFKPEAGNQLLCSLADETSERPRDTRPEEVDVARAIDRINTITTLGLRSVSTTWAGQRTFAPDRNPVWGFDDQDEGFYWLVGQGGWGIISSPAAGRIVSAAIVDGAFPADLAATGFSTRDFGPERLRTVNP